MIKFINKPGYEDFIGECLQYPNKDGWYIDVTRYLLIKSSGHFDTKPSKQQLSQMIERLKSTLDVGIMEAIRNSKDK